MRASIACWNLVDCRWGFLSGSGNVGAPQDLPPRENPKSAVRASGSTDTAMEPAPAGKSINDGTATSADCGAIWRRTHDDSERGS